MLAFPLGFGIAFVGSMPMSGPVAVLFMARILNAERATAFLVALGGSVVEAGYALGVASLLPHLVGRTQAVVVASLALGSVVVTTLGVVLIARPNLIHATTETSARRGFMRGALSSLLNPTLLATWTVAVSTLYANGWLSKHFSSAAGFALGVGLGSLAWFGILLAITKARRVRVTPALRTKLLRAMGCLLVLSGIFLAVRFVVALEHPERQNQRSIERAGKLLDEFSRRHGEH
jgi:threonine/homoserine/homoserine lactone efflux protein